MDDKHLSYLIYEAAQARNERNTKRLIVALIISVALMFISNFIWAYSWLQYDYESTETQEITVDSENGNANYIGNNGEINNGQNSSEKEKN